MKFRLSSFGGIVMILLCVPGVVRSMAMKTALECWFHVIELPVLMRARFTSDRLRYC